MVMMVCMSTGLWDVMDNQSCVNFVRYWMSALYNVIASGVCERNMTEI